MANKKSVHYVDNKKLYEVICQYKKEYREAQANGTPNPRIPEYAGKCIMEIAEKLSSKHNFSRYIFKDEMIGDGIENCIKYFHNFDEVKYSNPFTYLTTIIYWAFVRRIEQEKTYLYTKYKLYENVIITQLGNEMQGGDEVKGGTKENEMDTDKMNSFVTTFENKVQKKKIPVKKEKKGLEKLIEEV